MKFLVLGAGKMGQVVCYDFLQQKDVSSVVGADNDTHNLESLRRRFPDPRLSTRQVDVTDAGTLRALMKDADACVAAVHYALNVDFTRAAIAARTHLCDLGGNNDIVQAQLALDSTARGAGISIIPDCGLAPGMVSILTAWGVDRFDWADTVKIRVGGVPQYPRPPLNYSLSFSVEGLINEYVEPVRVLRDGEIRFVEPLSEFEALTFPEPYGTVEAFTTSGGISTLPESYKNRLKNLSYKTIRYPGHGAIMGGLYRSGFFSSEKIELSFGPAVPRELTALLLSRALPHEQKDVVLVRVSFSGTDAGRKRFRELTIIDLYDETRGITAMARMTAFPAAIVSMMQAKKQIARTGVFPQELGVPPQLFIDELLKRKITIGGL